MGKTRVDYRLSNETIYAIERIRKHYGLKNDTAVIEKAVVDLAGRVGKEQNSEDLSKQRELWGNDSTTEADLHTRLAELDRAATYENERFKKRGAEIDRLESRTKELEAALLEQAQIAGELHDQLQQARGLYSPNDLNPFPEARGTQRESAPASFARGVFDDEEQL